MNTIQASFGLDISPLQAGANKAQGIMARTFGSIQKGAAGLNLGGLLGGAALLAGARSVVNYASEINDLSDSVSLSTDTFQEFSFAIEQAGGKQTDLTKGMGALISKQQDALDGNEMAIASFAKLGITLEDLRLLRPDQILLRIADALKKSASDGRTTAATMDVLGSKVALKLIPSLKQGSAAFLEVGRSAQKMSADAIAALDAGSDRFDKMVRQGKANIGNNLFNLWGGITGQVGPDPSLPATTPQEVASGHAEVERRRARSPVALDPKAFNRPGSFFKNPDPRVAMFGKPLFGPGLEGTFAGGPGTPFSPFGRGIDKAAMRKARFDNLAQHYGAANVGNMPVLQDLDSWVTGSKSTALRSGGLTSGGLRTGGLGIGMEGGKLGGRASARHNGPDAQLVRIRTATEKTLVAMQKAWGV